MLREVHANLTTGQWDVNHSEGPSKFVGDTNGTKELFSYSLPCPIFASEHTSVSGGANLSVAGRINGTLSYGVVAAGVFGIHDPNVTEFSLFVDLDADIQGMMDVGVNLTVRTAVAMRYPIQPLTNCVCVCFVLLCGCRER